MCKPRRAALRQLRRLYTLSRAAWHRRARQRRLPRLDRDRHGRRGRPVSEGAASVVWAVTLPDDGPSGGFFRDDRALPW